MGRGACRRGEDQYQKEDNGEHGDGVFEARHCSCLMKRRDGRFQLDVKVRSVGFWVWQNGEQDLSPKSARLLYVSASGCRLL